MSKKLYQQLYMLLISFIFFCCSYNKNKDNIIETEQTHYNSDSLRFEYVLWEINERRIEKNDNTFRVIILGGLGSPGYVIGIRKFEEDFHIYLKKIYSLDKDSIYTESTSKMVAFSEFRDVWETIKIEFKTYKEVKELEKNTDVTLLSSSPTVMYELCTNGVYEHIKDDMLDDESLLFYNSFINEVPFLNLSAPVYNSRIIK